MVNQVIWIGIVIGVFIAGIGIGYAALQSPAPQTNFAQMTPQQMQQMMDDPQSMQEMHEMMMNDPQHMRQMMGPMMNTMMDDPDMRQQMMKNMKGHQGMMNMMNNSDCPFDNCPLNP